MKIKIQKGHDIRISGVPTGTVNILATFTQVGLVPDDFRSIKPKLLVKAGDKVMAGSGLFFDKNLPQVVYPSPAGGTIQDIIFGERRKIRKIIIAIDKDEKFQRTEPLNPDNSTREEIIDFILKANLWPLITQRPFGKTADPADRPKAIFISGLDTTPLAIDPFRALEGREDEFKAGLRVLTKLTAGNVNLSVGSEARAAEYDDINGLVTHIITGPHPAGNIGIQIHHIDPINPGQVVWTIQPQQVATLGKLFTTGEFDPTVVIAVGGPAVTNPGYIKTRIGAPIAELIKANIDTDARRVIVGDVLTGRLADDNDYLGFYHRAVTILPVSNERPFLGWARIGSSSRQYTLTNAYLKTGRKLFNFSSKRNGAERAIVPIEAWEAVLPMDIMPNPLFRSILANDVEEMEKLGILECDPDDFALATFACPSKIELAAVIRLGLELMEKEV
ncbi:MAG: Na(+)-translocating NADH-quinone reductase subunit A [Candidatus Marinimicrobia bacterium]|nr:Na(+)-translocating NADH-quinone reductase subunit A [Candidatus Neomarinimicrobiota bacterium]